MLRGLVVFLFSFPPECSFSHLHTLPFRRMDKTFLLCSNLSFVSRGRRRDIAGERKNQTLPAYSALNGSSTLHVYSREIFCLPRSGISRTFCYLESLNLACSNDIQILALRKNPASKPVLPWVLFLGFGVIVGIHFTSLYLLSCGL